MQTICVYILYPIIMSVMDDMFSEVLVLTEHDPAFHHYARTLDILVWISLHTVHVTSCVRSSAVLEGASVWNDLCPDADCRHIAVTSQLDVALGVVEVALGVVEVAMGVVEVALGVVEVALGVVEVALGRGCVIGQTFIWCDFLSEMDEFLVDMDEDVEGMQGSILLLQQQLKETKELVARLQVENANMCAQVANSQQQQPLPQQQQQFASSQQQQQPLPQQQQVANLQQQVASSQQQQQLLPQQQQQVANLKQQQQQQPLPQQQHPQYGCVQTTDSSSSVDRTTDAAHTPPEGAAARTTHMPPVGLAANNTETTDESRGATDKGMTTDDHRVRMSPTPTSEGDVSGKLHAAQPAAHSSETQLQDVLNGSRTADDRQAVVGYPVNNRTEEDIDMAECPTTNGQKRHETDLSQTEERRQLSACCYDETNRRHSRLHDNSASLKGSAPYDEMESAHCRSQLPSVTYETEGTDLSSDAWSPRSPLQSYSKVATKQLRGDTAMSDDDDDSSPGCQSLRTDAKSDGMPNGVVTPLTERQDT